MKTKIPLLFVSVMFICVFMSFENKAQSNSIDWLTIDTVKNVVISYQLSNCQGEKKLYLKIENKNETAVKVSWSFWGSDVMKSIVLNANETKKGDCNINAPVELDEIIPSGKTIADLVPRIIIN